MSNLKGNWINSLILVLLLLLVLDGGYAGVKLLSLSSVSYTTGYEGVKARYAGLKRASETVKGDLWSSTFRHDFDDSWTGLPDITGEMTSVFVPRDSLGEQQISLGGFDISGWLLNTAQVRNPVNTYEWQLKGDSTTTLYVMEEWELRWFVSVGVDPDLPSEIEWADAPYNIYKRRSLRNIEVWFELDLEPIWYFEGQETAYFAIAKLSLAENTKLGGLYEGRELTPDEVNDELSVTPMSRGSIVGIYYGLFGVEGNRADKEASTFRGKKLNPDLFTDKVYAKLILNDFGVSSWYSFGNHWRSDVATFAFKVRVFVVGQWTVKDIDDLPSDYGREAKTGGVNLVGDNPLAQWLSSPEGSFVMLLLFGIVVLVILAVVAPSFLLGLFAIFGGKRRR